MTLPDVEEPSLRGSFREFDLFKLELADRV